MTDRPAKITDSYRGYAIEISLEEAMGDWDNLYYSVHREADGLEMVCNFTSGREDPQWLLGSLKEDIDDMIAHPENWIDDPQDDSASERTARVTKIKRYTITLEVVQSGNVEDLRVEQVIAGALAHSTAGEAIADALFAHFEDGVEFNGWRLDETASVRSKRTSTT